MSADQPSGGWLKLSLRKRRQSIPLPEHEDGRAAKQADPAAVVDVVGLQVDGEPSLYVSLQPTVSAATMRLLIQVTADHLDDGKGE